MSFTIRPVDANELQETASQYCDLLADAVDSGASVGFLPPLDPMEALKYWNGVRESLLDGSRVLLGAYRDGRLSGSVQLGLETRANGSHRAEVMKLLVDRKARRQGAGTLLMDAVESAARQLGRTLLVLDTRQGDASWALYQKIGYVIAGEIPEYARSASGELHTTVFFYKKLH